MLSARREVAYAAMTGFQGSKQPMRLLDALTGRDPGRLSFGPQRFRGYSRTCVYDSDGLRTVVSISARLTVRAPV
jgi:hypothetical protein